MSPFQQHEYRFERAKESVITRTKDGIIKFWNRSAEKLYGWRKEEALGRVSHDLLQTQFPKPLEDIESELVRTGLWEGVLIHTTRDGDRFAVKSKWTLDPTLQSGEVVEINARSAKIEARADIHRVEIGRQEPGPARMTHSDTDAAPGTNLRVRTEETNLQVTRIANVVLAAAGAFCILVVFYAIFHYYGWTGEKNLIGPARLLIYFVFPGVLATVFFAALRLETRQKVGICLLLFSTTLSIYTLELFLGLTDSPTSPAEWFAYKSPQEKHEIAKKFGVDFDTRTKFEVLMALRKQGIDAEPYASASILLQKQVDGSVRSAIAIDGIEVVPPGGISNSVTILCNETGRYVIYQSDEHGFNNPKGIWDSDVKIAVIGDSFAHGSCVPPDKNFAALIRKQYPGTINLGGGGQGPLLMLATLKEYVEYLRPDVVLWNYFEGNDIHNFKDEQTNAILSRYLKSGFSQNLRERQGDIDRVLRIFVEREREQIASDGNKQVDIVPSISKLTETLFATMTFTQLRRRFRAIYETRNESEQEALVSLFGKILLDAKLSVEAWGGKLYFLYLPQWERYARRGLANKDRERVLSLVREMGIPVIDMHEAFQSKEDPLELFPFRQNAHYNEMGNELVAKEVLRVISVDP